MKVPYDTNEKLYQLTGLRYGAALLVFFSHLPQGKIPKALEGISKYGYIGVTFFFILSGFVLSYSYSQKIVSGRISFCRYIFLRLARLTPLHLLMLIPGIALEYYKSDLSFLKGITNLFYMQSWIPNSNYYFSFNTVSWSLSNEMFFYICFFFLIFLSTKNLIKLLFFLLMVVLFCAFLIEPDVLNSVFYGKQAFCHWLFYIFPLFRLLEFLTGMLLFKAWRNNFRCPKGFILPAYIFLFFSVVFAKNVPEAYRAGVFFLPSTAMFLYAHLDIDNTISRFWANNFMVLMGNASFALYMTHIFVIAIIKRINFVNNLSNFSFLIFTLFLVSLSSIIIYLYYEKKTNIIFKKLVKEYIN